MKPILKRCYVRLNRNFLDSLEDLKINNLPNKEKKNLQYSCSSKNIGCTSSPEVSSRNNYKLRKQGKIKYSIDSQKLCGETSESESSEEDISSDNEMNEEKAEPKKLNCLKCDKSFSSHSKYLIHKQSHLSKPFKCSLCSMGWKSRETFIYHMKIYHPEIQPFLCGYSQCEQSFKTKKLLEKHNKTHWRYMCKFCKKLFIRKYHMHKHVVTIH